MTDPGPPQPSTPVAVAGPVSAGYAELRRRIRQEGLMDRRPRYYAIKIAVLAVLVGGGGLNYQIEHHLFPAMPRPSLRRCRILVRAFCAQTGLLYCETGLVSSYSQVLRHLHAAGQ